MLWGPTVRSHRSQAVCPQSTEEDAVGQASPQSCGQPLSGASGGAILYSLVRGIFFPLGGFPRWLKNPPAMGEPWIWVSGLGRPPEKGTATQSSILSWWVSGLGRPSGEGNGNPVQYSLLENPRTESLAGCSARGRGELSDFPFHSENEHDQTHSPWRLPS